MSDTDTIFALSSGKLPSGIAVIRLSGPQTRFGLETLSVNIPKPRFAELKTIRNQHGSIIDQGLVLFFPAPQSFTGEDCAEIHLHGGRAVVQACFSAFSGMNGFRFAEAGEFTKRAFDNGKIDLTEAEGLADLISAETEIQRKLAIGQANGILHELYDSWMSIILRSRAFIEAELDFSDEEDIPNSISNQIWRDVDILIKEMSKHIDNFKIGEIQRSGFSVVIAGAPNAGKSSLLNGLAGRNIAIVSEEKGTTRDILEVRLDLNGHLVILKDTAGLRDTENQVEQEGIRRAISEVEASDLVLYLLEPDSDQSQFYKPDLLPENKTIYVGSKSDKKGARWEQNIDVKVSTRESNGYDGLLKHITSKLNEMNFSDDLVVPTRLRYIELLKFAMLELDKALKYNEKPIEIRSEHLRLAQEFLGKITGRVDVEDLLTVIFSEFCIGK